MAFSLILFELDSRQPCYINRRTVVTAGNSRKSGHRDVASRCSCKPIAICPLCFTSFHLLPNNYMTCMWSFRLCPSFKRLWRWPRRFRVGTILSFDMVASLTPMCRWVSTCVVTQTVHLIPAENTCVLLSGGHAPPQQPQPVRTRARVHRERGPAPRRLLPQDGSGSGRIHLQI